MDADLDKIRALAMALYLELEDQNCQAFCAMLNWMFDLYPASHYYRECIHMTSKMKEVTRPVKLRDGMELGFITKTMKMVIEFKEVKR